MKGNVDGATNQRGSGIGLVVISPDKIIIEKSVRLGFSATNNEAEYETLLVGTTMVQKMRRSSIRDMWAVVTWSDSFWFILFFALTFLWYYAERDPLILLLH